MGAAVKLAAKLLPRAHYGISIASLEWRMCILWPRLNHVPFSVSQTTSAVGRRPVFHSMAFPFLFTSEDPPYRERAA